MQKQSRAVLAVSAGYSHVYVRRTDLSGGAGRGGRYCNTSTAQMKTSSGPGEG
jgi:hypothetical protein